MHDALWMNQYLYLFGINAKEPFRLDNLKAFVHHRCRVDGNLGAHVPCGMTQGISLGYVSYLLH